MRFFRWLSYCFIAIIVCTNFAAAQVSTFSLPISFDSTASRAEEVLKNSNASTAALESLRSDLSEYRTQAIVEQESRSGRVETIRKQLNILGPKPPEGEAEEAEEVAKRRSELNIQLAEANAPLVVAQEAYSRAEGLITEIDRIINERQSETLLKLGPSPLNLSNWPTAFNAFGQYVSRLFGEAGDAFNNPTRLAKLASNAPLIIVLVLAGLFLIFPAWLWVSKKLEETAHLTQSRSRAFTAFVLSLGIIIAPMIGFYLITRGLRLADIFLLRGEVLFDYLPYIGLSIFGSIWVARNLYYKDSPGAALLNIDQSKMKGGKRTTVGLGCVFVLYFIAQAAISSENFSEETQAVLYFPLVLMVGVALFSIARKFRRYRTLINEDVEHSEENLSSRVFQIFNTFCVSVAFLGPILAALGYVNLGVLLVFSSVLSLALFASLFLIFALLVGLAEGHSDEAVLIAKDTSESNAGSKYKAALGVVLVCLAIPVLAMIWGADARDITDIWLLLREGVTVGDTRFSISDFLSFVLMFSIGYTVTRLLQTALRTVVLPSTRIDAAAQNSLVTGLGYVGIFFSALIAIMSTGLDLSNLAIVAGALSVGIGFGLQAIVSNFVSGIILLIERPIKIGDWVEVGAFSGYVRKISVRSTSIETFDRATVIVPNADLIAGAVTNRTLSNKQGRIIVPIGVAYGTDTNLVKELLSEIVNNQPLVLKLPAASVLFIGFGADSLDFEIRAILRDVNFSLSVKSAINCEISAKFSEAGIEIPFAQREVTIKNVDEIINTLTKSKK